MNTRLEKLAKELRMSRRGLIEYISKLDAEVDLKITDIDNLNCHQYDMIRCSLDMQYLNKRLSKLKPRGVEKGYTYDYSKAAGFNDLVNWIHTNDLNGFSTKDVRNCAPSTLPYFGAQVIATAMKKVGYTNKVIALEAGKQGRRWFKGESSKVVSFI